jgi:hypothetical protein
MRMRRSKVMDLNHEVAEKVMGWKRLNREGGKAFSVSDKAYWWDNESCKYAVANWGKFDPLKDLNQCFEVVKKLKIDDWIRNFSLEFRNGWWFAYFNNNDAVHADTPNEAILKAALEAV